MGAESSKVSVALELWETRGREPWTMFQPEAPGRKSFHLIPFHSIALLHLFNDMCQIQPAFFVAEADRQTQGLFLTHLTS